MAVFEYLTIEESSTDTYKSKGSRFIAIAYAFEDANQLKSILDAHKKEHFKAVHFCYAYRLGADGKNYRANDDGEPSGSAGLPILAQIDSKNLTNVLVVVIRYFGGTLLGVPGLIKAYKTATKMALDKAEIVKKIVEKDYFIILQYAELNRTLYTLAKMQIVIKDKQMSDKCKIFLSVPLNKEQDFLNFATEQNLQFYVA